MSKPKITVSFRISEDEREDIVEIGEKSFSKGVSTLLDYYKENNQKVAHDLKYKALKKRIERLQKEHGSSKKVQDMVVAYRVRLATIEGKFLKREEQELDNLFEMYERDLA